MQPYSDPGGPNKVMDRIFGFTPTRKVITARRIAYPRLHVLSSLEGRHYGVRFVVGSFDTSGDTSRVGPKTERQCHVVVQPVGCVGSCIIMCISFTCASQQHVKLKAELLDSQCQDKKRY